jgi:hypothetical protein
MRREKNASGVRTKMKMNGSGRKDGNASRSGNTNKLQSGKDHLGMPDLRMLVKG